MNGEQLGYDPTIEKASGEVIQPYVEQKENFGRQHFDTTIAFGNGPVKPVLLPSELSDDQRVEWEDFKSDPLHKNEPFFRVIEGQAFTNELSDVDKMPLSPVEREEKIEEIRNRWQHTGRLALTRWARQTALAAGLTLYLGITDRVMLSGGRSGNEWAKENLPTSRHESWPSEAELMKDIIVRRFGDLYEKKYGRPIEGDLELEDQSINTLENLANTINHNPDEFTQDKKISLLTADFHARRVAALTHLFGVLEAPRGQLSAQEMLRERAEIRGRKQYASDLAYFPRHPS